MTASQGSPRAHRFAAGREYTVGVEEELMLLDAETLALSPAIEPIVAAEGGRGPAKRELMQCQAEITTTPCRTAEELLEQLSGLRAALCRDAALRGIRIAGAGTHPFSHPAEQAITAYDRYRELVAALRYPARQVVCFGMHVHVSVAGADKAFQLVEALLRDLPLLLALSASSPFWQGEETGLASTRVIIGQAMPRTGVPPPFDSYDEFVRLLERFQAAGALADATYLWWDVRPQPRLGTLEVRIMDAQSRVEDSAAIAGLVQALVRHYGKLYDRGVGFRRVNRFVAAENRWLAARHGLRAHLVSEDGDGAAARALVEELLDRAADAATAVGGEWALLRVAQLLAEGTSSERQLRLFRQGHGLADIVGTLVRETTGA